MLRNDNYTFGISAIICGGIIIVSDLIQSNSCIAPGEGLLLISFLIGIYLSIKGIRNDKSSKVAIVGLIFLLMGFIFMVESISYRTGTIGSCPFL